MIDDTKQPIEAIAPLADLYNRVLTDEVLAMWVKALEGVTYSEVRQARVEWMKKSRWMPTPAEILELIHAARNEAKRSRDQRDRAEEHRINWTQAIRSSFNIPNGMRLLDYVDQQLKGGRDLDDIVDEVCTPNRREY